MTRRRPFNTRAAQAAARQVLNLAVAEAGVRSGWLELTTIWPSTDDVLQRFVMYVHDLVPARTPAQQTLVRQVVTEVFTRIDSLAPAECRYCGDRPYYREFAAVLLATARHIAGFRGYRGAEIVWDPRNGPLLPILLLGQPPIDVRGTECSPSDQYTVQRTLFHHLFLPEQFPFIQRLLCPPAQPARGRMPE